MTIIPFGDWLPDHSDLGNPGTTLAENVRPMTNGYGPVRGLAAYSGATDDRVTGAGTGIDNDGNTETFCGDTSKLYKLTDTTWGDESRGGGYTTGAGEKWRFDTYGNLVIATNFSDEIQSWALGTSSDFADLGTSVPKARYVATVRDHLVLAYTDDSADGVVPNRTWFSPIGDPADDDWGNVDKQSDFQDLYGADEITGAAGGEFGLIFARRSIHRMTYTGDERIFVFESIDRNIGCAAPGSLAQARNLSFFLSEDGFYAHDGATATPIGANKVDAYFFNRVNEAALGNVTSVIDPTRRLYLVGYPDGTNGDYPSRILCYRWDVMRWTEWVANHDILVRLFGAGYTLEDLDDISNNIDAFPESFDSPSFRGGGVLFGAFKDDKKLHTFGSDYLTARIDTAETQIAAPNRAFIRGIRPLVTGNGDPCVSVGYRDDMGEAVQWTANQAVNSRSGLATFRNSARFHRARLTVTGENWTRAIGIDVDAVKSGQW